MTQMMPGLFPEPQFPAGDIETAVREAFADLEAKGVLGPIERAKRAALIRASAALDRSLASGSPSVATSNVLKNVLESLDSLPRPAEGMDRELDAFDAALAQLTSDALSGGRA